MKAQTYTKQLVTLALVALALTAGAQRPQYTVVDLGALNGQSEAFAINNQGAAVGWSFTASGTRQAVLFRNGAVVPLFTPAGLNSQAQAIADNGTIVGRMGTKAARLMPQSFQDLGTLGGGESIALGLNELGNVALQSQRTDANWRAAAIQRNYQGVQSDLGTLGGLWSAARDVNNNRVGAGWAHTRSGPTHAVAIMTNGRLVDLGTLGGLQSEAYAINDATQVCGWADLSARHVTPTNRGPIRHAFRWAGGQMQDLGDPYVPRPYPNVGIGGGRFFVFRYMDGEIERQVQVYGVDTFGYGINRSGDVCGMARLYAAPARQIDRATVHTGGRMWDLNDCIPTNSGWILQRAWGINDRGQIVGQGLNLANGQLRAFLLNPVGGGGGNAGLSPLRFAGLQGTQVGPVFAETTRPNDIRPVRLYVRRDGMVSNGNVGGPYDQNGLSILVATNPRVLFGPITLTITNRSTDGNTANGNLVWNTICNQLEAAYRGFRTGPDGRLLVTWSGTNMRDILLAMGTAETEGRCRMSFSAPTGAPLSMDFMLVKGQGW